MAGVAMPTVQNGSFPQAGQEALKSVGIFDGDPRVPGWCILKKKQFATNVGIFLNRMLGCSLAEQKFLFDYFTSTLDAVVRDAKADGSFDDGIVQLKYDDITIEEPYPVLLHKDPLSGAPTNLVKLRLDRGHSFQSVQQRLQTFRENTALHYGEDWMNGPGLASAFYICRTEDYLHTGKPRVIMATEKFIRGEAPKRSDASRYFHVFRPNLKAHLTVCLADIKKNYRKAAPAEVEEIWKFWFEKFATMCTHGERCKTTKAGGSCDYGTRFEYVYLITGAVLPVWKTVRETMMRMVGKKTMQTRGMGRVVRTETTDTHERVIGLTIPYSMVDKVVTAIKASMVTKE